MSKPTAAELIVQADIIKLLSRNVFNTAAGKDLLKELKNIYVYGNLYCSTDRDTVYYVAQRDLILELESYSKNTVGGELPNGEDIS